MSYRLIAYEREGNVALIRMSDPATVNAVSLAMADELADAFERAGGEARAVILTGAGRGFCSGANLSGDVDLTSPDYDAGSFLDRHYNPMMLAIRKLRVPLVTAVNGAAAGIGCSLALAGDLIVAGHSAYFVQAFLRVGLVPDGGSAYLLVRSIGRPRALEMMLLGEKIGAAQALEWGMINRVVPDAELSAAALALAGRLAEGPTTSLASIRELAWRASETTFAEQLELERGLQHEAGLTADHREGVAAFRAKRAPRFTGK
jgi:2-(1,2-epoxy-1,2-dihydrophenyl)acetyl-CoA isomerase